MTDHDDDWLDRFYDAVTNLQPGEELPPEFQDQRTPEQTAADEWVDEYAALQVDKIRDPIAFVADEAKLDRQRELHYILRNLPKDE